MRQIITLLFFILNISLFGQTKVADFKECLIENSMSPKEYILDLFKTNDIVIIGERDHRDTTQYDLLLDIFEDKRFIEEVGFIYTEVGCINRTEWANEVLKSNYENDSEFESELIKLYRELDFNPLWEKYNMYKYLKGIYAINKNLEPHKKITIGLTDAAFDWTGMTRKKYQAFDEKLYAEHYIRDSIMAANFIQLYEKQILETGKHKALLIQSFPHAVNINLMPHSINYRTVGSYLVEKYSGKVKIIALNSINFGNKSRPQSLWDEGKWDAAFELTHCNPLGFNIASTPFAKVKYTDLGNVKGLEYQMILDGLIFYIPFYEFKPTFGIPNVVDKSFMKELMRRTIISQDKLLNRIGLTIIQPFYKRKNAKYYNNVRTFRTYESDLLRMQMKKWIEN